MVNFISCLTRTFSVVCEVSYMQCPGVHGEYFTAHTVVQRLELPYVFTIVTGGLCCREP
jgi:hypothetical protein